MPKPHPSPAKFLTGLLGAPIAHSASPAMHEQAAAALGVRCHYQLMEIAGADVDELRTLLSALRRIGFAGFNVTFPYKETIAALLDELAPGAAALGAVNTVVVRDGRLIGHNTDTTGFQRAVAPIVAATGHGVVALVGAGGVGKAIGFALAQLKVRSLRIFDTERTRAEKLAEVLQHHLGFGDTVIAGSVEQALEGASGVVNGTPVGMLPNRSSPVPEALLHAGLWVADAVYSPLWTPLLTAAKVRGARVMTGRDLAINQAADGFELFTGLRPSEDAMGRAFDDHMAARYAASSAA